jgi:glycosyltransferase involved in cell wall biosynthesis
MTMTRAAATANVDLALFLPALSGGGAERITLLLADGFVARGLRVDLVLGVHEGPYLDQIPAGVRVVTLGSTKPLGKLMRLSRYLREARPPALLSALDNINLSTAARNLAGVPTRVVLGVHNTMSRDMQSVAGMKAAVRRFALRATYRWADGIVAVSHGVARDLAAYTGLPESRLSVIYNPVVTNQLTTLARGEVAHPWANDPQIPLVLAVGRLVPQKDFATLLRAFALVRRRCGGRSRLAILGEGAERAPLESLARQLGLIEDVAFCGFVANPYAWMAKSRLVVASSKWEGLPTVLIEAMATGTPVVSTDCPSGPHEILDGGTFGTLVPVGNADALADAITAALGTANDPARLQRRAQTFSVDSAVDAYLQTLFNRSASVNAHVHHAPAS